MSVESDTLHARVKAFARAGLVGRSSGDTFDGLAVDIARYQASRSAGLRRLLEATSVPLQDASSIPAVPVEAFRVARVAAHPDAEDVACFVTSGTTADATGRHPFRTLDTYRELCIAFGARALRVGGGSVTVGALLPTPAPMRSSLGFMARCFVEAWDGRSLSEPAPFDPLETDRWLVHDEGVDVAGVGRIAAVALGRGGPLLLVSPGFALVLLLDRLGDRTLALPPGSVVMITGGFKGRSREVDAASLTTGTSRAFCVAPDHVVGEYGMTELSSQLYEGVLPGAALHGHRGTFLPPPWLRVTPVDPVTLEPVPSGETGLARFVDLANVDSAVCIVTQDRVRASAGGIELFGRHAGAPARGCSLAMEHLLP